jgi:hypothetical protein
MTQDVHVKLNPGCHSISNIQEEEGSFYQQSDLNLRKKLLKRYIWSTAVYGAEIWTIRKLYQKCLENFQM